MARVPVPTVPALVRQVDESVTALEEWMASDPPPDPDALEVAARILEDPQTRLHVLSLRCDLHASRPLNSDARAPVARTTALLPGPARPARPRPRPAAGSLVRDCRECGRSSEQPRRHGHPFMRCPDCRDAA